MDQPLEVDPLAPDRADPLWDEAEQELWDWLMSLYQPQPPVPTNEISSDKEA